MSNCLVVGDNFILVNVPQKFCRELAKKWNKDNQDEIEMMIDTWVNKVGGHPATNFFLNVADDIYTSEVFFLDTYLESIYPEAGIILMCKQ